MRFEVLKACQIESNTQTSTYLGGLYQLRGLVVATVILVFQHMEERILFPDDGFPASRQFDLELAVVFESSIVPLTENDERRSRK